MINDGDFSLQLNGKMDQMGMQLVPGGGQHNFYGGGMGMFGAGGAGGGALAGFGYRGIGAGAGAGAPIRTRGAEIVSALQTLVDDCDKLSGESQGGASAQKEAITKLEDKIQQLQV